MNNPKGPYVFNTAHNLLDNYARLFLSNVLLDLEQHTKVIAICVLLHHIYIRARFNCLMQTH